MAQEAKDLKIKRRSAKAKLTRLSNAIQQLLDSDREVDEVTECVKQLELAYQDLQIKHEAYCMLIQDDEEFEKEEVWMKDCQTVFMTMKMQVKDHYKEQATDVKVEGVNEVLASTDTERGGLEIQTRPSPSPQVEATACKVQMERPRLPRFSGDVREYAIFRSDFHHLIDSRYSKRDAITLLRTCLQGTPADLIRGIGNDYDAAWAHLDNIYGDPRFVSDAIVHDLGKFRPLKEGEDARFCDLVHLVRRSYNTLKEVGQTHDMDNSHMLAMVERKMSQEDRKVWFASESVKTAPSFLLMLDWMAGELKINLVDQCKKILSKRQPDRFQLMKDNHACFSCLKKAGREHRMTNCKRRKRCTELVNGAQCAQISLVKQSLAEELNLKGRPISINITKVGGDVEEVHTKFYRMKLQSLDDKRVYGVSAVGLQCINNDIAEVQIEDLAKTFHLNKRNVHRGVVPSTFWWGSTMPTYMKEKPNRKGAW
ncbi:PREDICTED: uncharacterized protein LOC106813986 [Priapulus caudatus]|uniref:Uncharacterized protein LOC106813986 n=1 Tax=Priapulus caudatus TaxID=37621 RepID=A0ABM1ENF6_PRICU|nr:PREDICTED: uncharacterized protein LOC106813986 [Priapulus caudatus]